MHRPYHDKPFTSGLMRTEPAVFFDVIPKFLRDGWQVVGFLLVLMNLLAENDTRMYMPLVTRRMALSSMLLSWP